MKNRQNAGGGPVVVNSAGDIIVNGVRSPMRVTDGTISFVIKDRRVADARGSRVVNASVGAFVAAIQGTVKNGGSSGE